MNRRSILCVSAAIILGLSLLGTTAGSTASAAEIKLLSAVALYPAIDALIPEFEKSSGHKVTVAYGTAGGVADRVQKGEAADIVISAAPRIDQLQAQGKVVAESRVTFAKVVSVPSCAREPRSPTLVQPKPSSARCWPQDRLPILILPVGAPVVSTWPACSNDWASLEK